jgi:hypothetical protein
VVQPTLEVTIRETVAHLRRKKRPDLGIALVSIQHRHRRGLQRARGVGYTINHIQPRLREAYTKKAYDLVAASLR